MYSSNNPRFSHDDQNAIAQRSRWLIGSIRYGVFIARHCVYDLSHIPEWSIYNELDTL